MDPLTLLTGVASIGGGFMKGFMGGPGAGPAGPNISSATSYSTMNSAFNVGGNAVEAGSVTGVLKSWGPLLVVAVGAWLLLRK